MIIKSYERRFVAVIHAQSCCKGACHTLDILNFILIPKTMIVLISLNQCGMKGVGIGELRKGENDLSRKKILLAFQITIELVVVLGITRETS